MRSDRPYLLTLLLCLVIQVHCQDDLDDLIAEESTFTDIVEPLTGPSESKDVVPDYELTELIRPTMVSKMGGAGTTIPGKPTTTVTAIRLGTSRYFHQGTFDPERDEYPHSVIYSVSAEAPTGAPLVNDTSKNSNSKINSMHEDEHATLPSFDYDHEFMALTKPSSSHLHFPDLHKSPDLSTFLSEITAADRDFIEKSHNRAEEPETLELLNLSGEFSPAMSAENVSRPLPNLQIFAMDEARPSFESRTSIQNLLNYPTTAVPVNVSQLNRELLTYDSDETNSGGEDLLSDFVDRNDIPEALPNPIALIAPVDNPSKDNKLQDEFAEALRKVEPRPRQRRPGPGTRRRVRKRVKTFNNGTRITSDGSGSMRLTVEPSNSFNQISESFSETESNTRAPNKRYRSTTTTPVPDPSPPTISYTKFDHPTPSSDNHQSSIVVKNGPTPIILKSANGQTRQLQVEKATPLEEPPPQIEKPNNFGFTEKISTYFFPSPMAMSNSNFKLMDEQKTDLDRTIGKFSNESTDEWLQSANSKVNHVHHEEELQPPDRDTWEKNYMNLQQNSFYGAVPEDVEPLQGAQDGQTLVDINRSNENGRSGLNPDDNRSAIRTRDSQERRQYPPNLNSPANLRVHSVTIPENEEGASVTFNSPKIVFVGGNINNGQEILTESPEVSSVQRPPPEFQHHRADAPEYVSHLERPLIRFHSDEDHTGINHPDLTGPTSSSEPQFEQTHYDRTKYDFVDPVDLQSMETDQPIAKPIDVEVNPSDGKQQEQQSSRGPPYFPQQPQPYPAKPAKPFNSQGFLGFGNEKHLMPEYIPSNKKSQNPLQGAMSLEKQPNIFSSIRTETSTEGIEHFPDPETLSLAQNKFLAQPFHKSSGRTGKADFATSLPFISFPKEFGPSQGPNNPLSRRPLPSPNSESEIPGTSKRQSPFAPQYARTRHGKNSLKHDKQEDSLKSSDFSSNYPKGAYHSPRYPGVSPTITLPMPGLVSVPTPPPDSRAMHEVTPNRHFPPHTHSMSSRPDYEPANPPLPNGHPLQQHFDPFIQNAGQFHDEHIPKQHGGNNVNENFKNFNGPSQSSFAGHGSPYYAHPESKPPPNQQRPPYEFDYDTTLSGKPASTNWPPDSDGYRPGKPYSDFETSNFKANIEQHLLDNLKFGDPPQETSQDDEGSNGFDGFKNNLETGFPKPGIQQYLEYEGESKEAPKDVSEQKPVSTPSPYSSVPYVLMFSNNAPDAGSVPITIPVAPKLKPNQIKTVDPTAVGSASEIMNSMGMKPGYHTVPVHPRDQMLQVLASAHYENMLEEYVEKKKRPPSSIYTPYGVLVPMGPTGAASAHSEAQGHGDQEHGHSPGPPVIQPPHGHGISFNIQSPLLTAHKQFGHDKGRVVANFGLKASVEPALEALAEKVALKLSALEHILKHHPKHSGVHLSVNSAPHHHGQDQGHQHAQQPPNPTHHEGSGQGQGHQQAQKPQEHHNFYQQEHQHGHENGQDYSQYPYNDGSHSEQKPVKSFPNPKPKNAVRSSFPLNVLRAAPNKKTYRGNESSEIYKLYIKELLKERLAAMYNEIEESASELVEQKILSDESPPPKTWAKAEKEDSEKVKFITPKVAFPTLGTINLSRKQSAEPVGILQSIKRFFSFGKPAQAQSSSFHEPIFNHIPNINFVPNFSAPPPQENERSNTLPSSNRTKKKKMASENENKASDKLNAKDIEKILSILLKADGGTSSKETTGQRKSDNYDSWSVEKLEPSTSIPNLNFQKKLKKFTLEDAFEPMTSGSSNRVVGIRMVAPPRRNVINSLDTNRRNFNSKIDKGHWRIPRSYLVSSRVPSSRRFKPKRFSSKK